MSGAVPWIIAQSKLCGRQITSKKSVGILTDLNLLPYQTAIMQQRNFNKDVCTIFDWI